MSREADTEITRSRGRRAGSRPEALPPGAEIAGHRIEAELGRGGMGVVYRARHLALAQPRALKLIAGEAADDPRFRARFRHEARSAAAIDHPNVVDIRHAGDEEGVLYISMALIDGDDLAAIVAAEGPLEPTEAVGVTAAVAGALDAAHASDLIHRDVKPSNILVEGRGDDRHVYLTDFGVSRPADTDPGLTAGDEFLGTPDYCSPEQVEGEPVDPRSDVYSLGAVVHFMLTGEPPFPRRTAPAKLVAHSAAPRPRPSASDTDLPPALDGVIARAMAVRPRDRFASAGELARALERAVVAGEAPPQPGRGRARRRLAAAGTAALALALALAGAIALLLGGDEAGPIASVEVGEGPVHLAVSDSSVWAVSRDDRSVSAIDPDDLGSPSITVPVGAERPRALATGFGSIWVADPHAGELIRLAEDGSGEELRIPVGDFPSAIAAGGRWVWVAATGDDAVVRVDPETNAVERTVSVGTRPRALAIGAGSVWVANTGGGSISRIDPDRAVVVEQLGRVGRRPHDIAVGAGSVWVVDLVGSRLRRVDIERMETVDPPLRVDPQPRAVTVGLGRVWVTSSREGTISPFDPQTGEPAPEPIAVGGDPTDVVVGFDAVWAANFADGTVVRIEP